MTVVQSATEADACGADPSSLCEWVFDATGNEFFAEAVDWFVQRPLKILVIVVVAFVANRLARGAIGRYGRGVSMERTRQRLRRLRSRTDTLIGEEDLEGRKVREMRVDARTNTVIAVLSSVASIAIVVVAGLLVLGELGIDLAPLLAGAGVAGIALGFGAQTIVKDFLAGLFMLIEDQFGVGDVIDVGDVTGTVEEMSLRVTVLRDVDGTVWHVPNGEIHRVANKSQIWSRAVLDVSVSYDTDLRLAQEVIQRVADELWHDADFVRGKIIEAPEVWGVEDLGPAGVSIRLVVKTDPSHQWTVARELRLRIKEVFDEMGIEIPFPQQVVWLREPDLVDPPARPPSGRAV